MTEIKEIEEQARLHYMDRKVDEITGGENVGIAGVISDLKAEGYHIEERVSGTTTVTGIVLNENSIKMNKNSEASLTCTLVYGAGTVKYYAEVRGKYYEIINENENIIVRTEETNLEGIDNTPKVIAQSNAENIVTARTGENDTIVINSLNELGETIVTVKEENSGTTVACNVKVMALIEGITFNQNPISIEKGNNVDLSSLVTINPIEATEELVWTTGDGEIIEITEDGKLVGIEKGTTTLKVTNEAGTIETTCQVKVVISATGITLNKSTTTINKGNTDILTVTLTPADTTDEVNWTSESTSIASITPDATGKTATIRAIGAGTTKITVTCGSKTAYCTVTVKVPATGLSISPSSANVEIGGTLQLTATATPSDATDKITWKSSNIAIATVSSTGLVTGKKVGGITITATCGSIVKECKVYVGKAIQDMGFNNSRYTINVSGKVKVEGTVVPSDFTERILFSSEDETIAKVGSDGVVYGVSSGETWISAKSESGSAEVFCKIIVNNKFDVSEFLVNNGLTVPQLFKVEGTLLGDKSNLNTLTVGNEYMSSDFDGVFYFNVADLKILKKSDFKNIHVKVNCVINANVSHGPANISVVAAGYRPFGGAWEPGGTHTWSGTGTSSKDLIIDGPMNDSTLETWGRIGIRIWGKDAVGNMIRGTITELWFY